MMDTAAPTIRPAAKDDALNRRDGFLWLAAGIEVLLALGFENQNVSRGSTSMDQRTLGTASSAASTADKAA